jgi:cysteine-rich repeat protein
LRRAVKIKVRGENLLRTRTNQLAHPNAGRTLKEASRASEIAKQRTGNRTMMFKTRTLACVAAALLWGCASEDGVTFSDANAPGGSDLPAAQGGHAGSGSVPKDEPSSGKGGAAGQTSTATAGNGGAPSGVAGGGQGSGEAPVCGNGVIETGETCDDGARQDGDGCNQNCAVTCADFDEDARQGPSGSCYLYDRRSDTWNQARAECEKLHAHLVTVTSAEENTFVNQLSKAEVWLGATDGKDDKEPNPGTYAWITGEPFVYTAWVADNPNAIEYPCALGRCYEHCAGMQPDSTWKDWPCRGESNLVCEWDPKGTRP